MSIIEDCQVLIDIIEEAGYTYAEPSFSCYGDFGVSTKETANCEDDIDAFIDAVSNVTGKDFTIIKDDRIEGLPVIYTYHSDDYKLGGIIVPDGNARLSKHFELVYSKEGLSGKL